jgi:pimeloyl-ACP methyl ester carboxylesterase
MPDIHLPQGTVNYRIAGPADASGSPVVFVHGFLVDGSLWTRVADLLAARGIRSYAPDWPLGSHRVPLNPDAEQSPRGVAMLVLAFIEALDLHDVTLVGNDTGGAICQFLLDTDAQRIGRVVLTNCDACESFPPFPFNIVFRLAKSPMIAKLLLAPMRARFMRHSPLGYGMLARRLDAQQTRAWIQPALEDRVVRRDASRFLRAVKPKELSDVSTRLSRFGGPVKLVWGAADRSFTLKLGKRLQQAFETASLVELPTARTFVPLDEPERLADEIAATIASSQLQPATR